MLWSALHVPRLWGPGIEPLQGTLHVVDHVAIGLLGALLLRLLCTDHLFFLVGVVLSDSLLELFFILIFCTVI